MLKSLLDVCHHEPGCLAEVVIISDVTDPLLHRNLAKPLVAHGSFFWGHVRCDRIESDESLAHEVFQWAFLELIGVHQRLVVLTKVGLGEVVRVEML